MKNLIFAVLLLASFSVNAASDYSYHEYMRERSLGWDFSYPGGTGGGAMTCSGLSCSGSQYGAFTFIHVEFDQNITPIEDEYSFFTDSEYPPFEGMYFFTGVFKEFLAGMGFTTQKSFNFSVSYTSFGLEDLVLFAGTSVPLSSPSGHYESTVEAGQSFSLGMRGFLSDAAYMDDAFFSYTFTINPVPVSEVPIPAPFLLLAPFGVLLIARKYKFTK